MNTAVFFLFLSFSHLASFMTSIQKVKQMPIHCPYIARLVSNFSHHICTTHMDHPRLTPFLISNHVTHLQLSESGMSKYFSSGWNFIDISMMTLMLTSYLTWIIFYCCDYNPKEPKYKVCFFTRNYPYLQAFPIIYHAVLCCLLFVFFVSGYLIRYLRRKIAQSR